MLLFCKVLPHIAPFSFEGEANAGDSVQLNCYVAKGDTPLSIAWIFKDEPLSLHLGILTTKIGERTSLLTIASVMAGHAGNYTCSAFNQAGSANHSTTLFVNGLLTIYLYSLFSTLMAAFCLNVTFRLSFCLSY